MARQMHSTRHQQLERMRQSERSIRRGILDYLARHPEAQDTLEGIVEWWLLEQRIVWAIADVKMALQKLVAAELVLKRRSADGTIHYRANPEYRRRQTKKSRKGKR